MAAAVAGGVTWFAVVTWLASGYASRGPLVTDPKQLDPGAAQVNVMVYGTTMGIFLMALLAWILMAPIASTFRKGGLAMVAALGGLVFSMALTWIVRASLGQTALPALSLVAGGVAILLVRRAVALR